MAAITLVPPALLLCCGVLTRFDLKFRRVPNIASIPLLLTGVVLGFPGSEAVWMTCLVVLTGWRMAWVGGGDAKLWMALLWLAHAELGDAAVPGMALVFLVTAAGQLAWRILRRRPALGVKSPAVWRTLPFIVWFWMVS